MSKNKVTISFKVSPADKVLIADRAFARGLSLSQYCEGLVLDHFDGPEDDYERRGDRVLSQDDLDAIAGRVSLEIEARDLARQEAPPAFPETIPDDSVLAVLLDDLDVPEAWKAKIRQYVDTALENGMIDEDNVLIRMLAYAYQHLSPKYTFWGTEMKEVSREDLEEIFIA